MRIVPREDRAALMYRVESFLGLSAEGLAALTVGVAVARLKKLGEDDVEGAMGLARAIVRLATKALSRGMDATPQSLLFPSQKGGKPVGRVSVWRMLGDAARALGKRGASVLRVLQRGVAGLGVRPAPGSALARATAPRVRVFATPAVPVGDGEYEASGEGDYYEPCGDG